VLPVFCETCGLVFPSQSVTTTLSGWGNVGFSVFGGEPCPRCGDVAQIAEGHFNMVGGVIEVLSAPDLTYQRLGELAAVLERGRDAPGLDLTEELREESPRLAALYATLSPRVRHVFIAFLLFVIQTFATIEADNRFGDAASETQLREAVRTLEDEARHDAIRESEIQRAVEQALSNYQAQPRVSPSEHP
jgi:hypothetical protein